MLENLRLKLAHAEALPLLIVLGILTGVFAGGIIICFRLLTEFVQQKFLAGGDPENYESLSIAMRFVGGFATIHYLSKSCASSIPCCRVGM